MAEGTVSPDYMWIYMANEDSREFLGWWPGPNHLWFHVTIYAFA